MVYQGLNGGLKGALMGFFAKKAKRRFLAARGF
jgi:hypothetical protein